MTPPTVQFIPAAATVEDWDTYADGAVLINSLGFGTGINDGVMLSSTSFSTSQGWFNSINNPASRYYDETAGEVFPPYVAMWNETDGVWRHWKATDEAWTGTNASNTVYYDSATGSTSGTSLNGQSGKKYIFIYLTQAPTNWAGWRDYDGPTS